MSEFHRTYVAVNTDRTLPPTAAKGDPLGIQSVTPTEPGHPGTY